MARFFMAGTNIKGSRAIILGQDAEHIQVLRLKPGEDLVICDGRGKDYRCRLVRSDKEEAEAEIVEVTPCRAEPTVEVTVFAGLSKGERADVTVQKCVEAGADSVVFFNCERCVARPDAKGLKNRRERWQRIAQAAAQQAGRGIIPVVGYMDDYVEMLNAAMRRDARLFMYEAGEDRVPLRQALEDAGEFRSCSVITGPEGGFTAAEAKMARACGFTLCSMGERILRCETAPLVALSAIMYHSGNLA